MTASHQFKIPEPRSLGNFSSEVLISSLGLLLQFEGDNNNTDSTSGNLQEYKLAALQREQWGKENFFSVIICQEGEGKIKSAVLAAGPGVCFVLQ